MHGTRTLALLLAALPIAACHTMRFEIAEGDAAEVVRERHSFFVGGLFPTREVDVSKRCPHGVVALREETTFVDGLFNAITLGIWTPRSAWYHCASPGGSP